MSSNQPSVAGLTVRRSASRPGGKAYLEVDIPSRHPSGLGRGALGLGLGALGLGLGALGLGLGASADSSGGPVASPIPSRYERSLQGDGDVFDAERPDGGCGSEPLD
jgi:hypothetical protein